MVAALVELDEMVRVDVGEVEKSGGQQEKMNTRRRWCRKAESIRSLLMVMILYGTETA